MTAGLPMPSADTIAVCQILVRFAAMACRDPREALVALVGAIATVAANDPEPLEMLSIAIAGLEAARPTIALVLSRRQEAAAAAMETLS